jgi:ADP-ribose pyrophosphatase YjhB (NUDIX family)
MAELNYVLGFVFSKNEVLLIRKPKGTLHAGKWNGPGGHIESTDSNPLEAMKREWDEETGLPQPRHWWPAARLDFAVTDAVVHLYAGETDSFVPVYGERPKDAYAERALMTPIEMVNHEQALAPHVGWMIAMCRNYVVPWGHTDMMNIDTKGSDIQTEVVNLRTKVFGLNRQLDGHQHGGVRCLVIYYTTANSQFRIVLKEDSKTYPFVVEAQTNDALGRETWQRVESSGVTACALSVMARCLREHRPVRYINDVYAIEMGVVTT